MQDLLASLNRRIDAYTQRGDASAILAEEALAEADALVRTSGTDTPDGASVPLAAVDAVARLHWNRSLALPGRQGADDRRTAAELFAAIAEVDPTLVPRQFRPADATPSTGGTPDLWAGQASELLARVQRVNDPAALDQAVGLLHRAVAAVPAGRSDRVGWLANLSIAHRMRFDRLGDPTDLDAAVAAAQEAAATVGTDHPFRAGVLSALGNALQSRFTWFDDTADIDAAVDVLKEAAALTAGRPDRGRYLTNLGLAYQARFERTDDRADINAAVSAHRSAAAATSEQDPDRSGRTNNLSTSLQIRARRYGGSREEIDEAVAAARAAVESSGSDHPEHPGFLSTLGIALQARFEQSGDPADIDGAAAALREAVAATGAGDPLRPGLLSNQAEILRARYERFNTITDVTLAVSALREAVVLLPEDGPRRAIALGNLCIALRSRFDGLGAVADIDDAVAVGRQAVAATPADHPDLVKRLSALAMALLARSELTGDIADIDDSVAVSRRAVATVSADRPERPRTLSGLSGTLLTRFRRTGDVADLDQAVAVGREAVAGAPDDVVVQHNLAWALETRFERDGELADIDAAVAAGRAAVVGPRAGDPERPLRLSSLGTTLRARFARTGDAGDLDEAVAAHREAVESVAAGHPDRAMCLSMYEGALRRRFDLHGDSADLDAAVAAGRASVDAVAAGHPARATYLSNLGSTLRARFKVTGNLADVEAAIDVARQAVAATPADHPFRGRFQYTAGLALRARFDATDNPSDAREALDLWRRVTSVATAPTAVRLGAARAWGDLAAALGDWRAAADGYAEAVHLLPLLAWLGAGRRSREQLLSAGDGLAADAAACAIAAGQPDRALELLEQGRGVMWSQMLETRTDLTVLQDAHPGLAGALAQVRLQLDGPAATAEPGRGIHRSADAAPAAAASSAAAAAAASAADSRIEAARRWGTLLDQVRALPGFQDFASPPSSAHLRCAAADGAVVIVNISQWRCDALVVTKHSTEVIALSGLTRDDTVAHVNTYLTALQDFRSSAADADNARGTMERTIGTTLEWLWDVIAEPVLSGLGHHDAPADGAAWPRLWWCPTGPLTVVPLHAAGYHERHDGSSVLDRVISSYTPTLRALSAAREKPRAALPGRLLLISLPDTPGAPPLPAVAGEKAVLTGAFDDSVLTLLEGADATHDAVIRELATHPWVHASCHGDQNMADPTSGGLLPYDWAGAGTVSVLDLAAAQHDGGEFAFLSACKSATGGVAVLDEAVSLAAALHYVGWRQVVGTLWSVWDADAARITRGVYQRLGSGTAQASGAGQPSGAGLNPSATAEALHETLREYRQRDTYDREPSRWAPFLHIGP